MAGESNRDMNNQLQIYLTACELLGAGNSADSAQMRTRWARLAGAAERKLRAFVSSAHSLRT